MEDVFWGYRRADGGAGARNYLAVIPTVYCVNEVARRLAVRLPGSRALTHHQGCGLLQPDLELVTRVLINLGTNPNVGAALVVSLGCESVSADAVAAGIAATGRPVELLSLHDLGGYSRILQAGLAAGERRLMELARQGRAPCSVGELVVGLKCGSSDTTSGLSANPALGVASDRVVAAGGTCLFSETPELMGAEPVLARRTDAVVHRRLCDCVGAWESEVERFGVDMRGSQPTRGNIAGGITTIEEKALGGICKSGSAPIRGVLAYGERPPGPGLYFTDASGRELESLTALAASGAQVIAFATGRGAPHGFPIVPVLKVCGNARTCAWLAEHIDVDVSGIISGELSPAAAGDELLRRLLTVASGEETAAERLGYCETMDIQVAGPPV